MFLSVSKYIIQALNTTYRIAWQDSKCIKRQIDIDLEQVLFNYLNSHLQELGRIIQLSHNQDINLFLEDPLALQLLNAIPNSDIIPGLHFQTEQESQDWQNKQLTLAYNKLHKIHIDYELFKDILNEPQ